MFSLPPIVCRSKFSAVSRTADGFLRKPIGAEDTVELESIGCRLMLADIYEKVEFPAEARQNARA